jgi:Cu-Zn family superoxide dismutase
MYKKLLFAGTVGLVFNVNMKQPQRQPICSDKSYQITAICLLRPSEGSSASGTVIIKQESVDKPTLIRGKFSGLKKNSKHGFHVHEFGDLSDGCTTAGPHYNPLGKTHGGPEDTERHVGDLGNINSDDKGEALYEREDQQISLLGKYSVVGRSLVLHNDEDDLGRGNFPDSKTTGHSGSRIACGVIALCTLNKSI